MAKDGITPKSIRFEPEIDKRIEELKDLFEESAVKVLARAVNYLYENKEKAIDYEANRLKEKIKQDKK